MFGVGARSLGRVLVLSAAFGLITPGAGALETLVFRAPGADKTLEDILRVASVLLGEEKAGNSAAQDLFADARAEYGALLNALYAAGHYSGVIHVYIDGREAASIAPLDAPSRIDRIEVVVEPGPAFTFSRASVHPLPRDAEIPQGFARGKPAESGQVLSAVTAGIDAWRGEGHAKARAATQDVVAHHRTATLSADVTLDPGPRLRFGPLTIEGNKRMRTERIRAITGLPEGEVYDPAELEAAKSRLRRSGVFSSVTLTEAERILSPDLLPITATVIEEKPRRYTFGAELASFDGVSLTGGWLHRNLFGGGERLQISGAITNIGATTSGIDYALGLTLSRPATFTPDTTLTFETTLAKLDQEDFTADLFGVTLGLSHVFSDNLSGSAGFGYEYARVTDETGVNLYRNLSLPLALTWDRRNSKTDATKGFYIDAKLKPFLGFGITDTGARLALDLRGYRGFGSEERFVLAARLQAGAILGASLPGTPRDYLFYSGGGGTVRGQPYQSLGVNVLKNGPDSFRTGGTQFLAASIEGRAKITEKIGVVGFFDVGRVDALGFFSDVGDWHAGAGLGLRYATAVGPIRLDLAMPAGGKTGDGLQIYVGLGQAF
jgi:translocation and assembly module TamA